MSCQQRKVQQGRTGAMGNNRECARLVCDTPLVVSGITVVHAWLMHLIGDTISRQDLESAPLLVWLVVKAVPTVAEKRSIRGHGEKMAILTQ